MLMRTLPRALWTILAVVVAVSLALPAPAGAAGGPSGAALRGAGGGDDLKDKKKDDKGSKEKGEGKDGEKKDDKDQPKEPTFEKAVKDAKELKGLFTVYVKEDEAKHLLELAPDQLDVPYLLNPTLVSGVGQGFIYPADMLPEYVVSFHRVGKNVQLIHRNTLFRADDAAALRKPATVAVPDAIVGQAKIESQPHPERKSVLIDLGPIFMNDLEGLGLYLKAIFEVPYQLDKDGSSIAQMKPFSDNLDLETVLHFKTGEVKKQVIYAADSRSLLVRFHYSIARLPATGYRPRLADDRVGHFLAMMGDYTSDRPDDPTVRYVTRWHLEKKDPAAPLSEPKQPIVFYLENSIPKEYREAVRQGVLGWNPAFEALGFKDAMVVKEQPDDPDWDAADVRYSTLRWIVAPNAGFAQGPSRINPYTGQIFDADIRFSADMIRGVRREADELVAPVAAGPAPGAASPETVALLNTLRGWTSFLGPLAIESLVAAGANGAGGPARPALGAGSRRGVPPAALGYCDYNQGLAQQAALGWSLLDARGLLDPEAKEKYVNDFIIHVTLHEVGHTLGLRHNFRASSLHPFARLQDEALTTRVGLTGSVMDYIPVNIAPEGQPQGQFWQTTIGPYDRWAIEYAYKPIAADSIEAEKGELARIASRSSDPALAYGTDEDDFGPSPRGIDPTTNKYDNAGDILVYYQSRAAITRELFSKMEERFSEPGTRYQKLRQVFAQGISEIWPAAVNIPKYVGGIRHHRDHIGDPNGRLPYEPVPAAEQRAALAFLSREVLGPEAFQIPPRLLNKLAIERLPDMEGNIWMIERNDVPIHTLVLAIQSLPIDRLYHPISLGRLNDNEARYTGKDQAFTMAEMFAGVRAAVWSELDARTSVNSFRRNLQRKHLQTLVRLVVQLDAACPEDARTLARADLVALRGGIDRALGGPGRLETPANAKLDVITRAHLEETRSRIEAALAASLERQMPRPAVPGGQQG
jgi:hypothetical protein